MQKPAARPSKIQEKIFRQIPEQDQYFISANLLIPFKTLQTIFRKLNETFGLKKPLTRPGIPNALPIVDYPTQSKVS